MSVQKLIAEAEKFLEKGKITEAIEKLKSAVSSDPLNQLVATKLSAIYVANDEPEQATKILIGLANRLSDAGKSQVAIAIYKQAIDLTPNDIDLRVKFALECEEVGKLGDAYNSAQIALQHFLKRKKYFDAANLMPLLVRTQSKDTNMKAAWVEVMQAALAEQKLVHLLVAFCGPPGLMSQEFSVGGDPSALPEKLYIALKNLVAWFPRDPKIAYAVAWAAYKREKFNDFYFYLKESLRREPDFCLSLLLFSRALSDQKKLNEALFVYRHLKEKVNADKYIDQPTINRLLDAFVEKNGWISFMEDSTEELSPKDFLGQIKGEIKDKNIGEPKREEGSPLEAGPTEKLTDQKQINEIELGATTVKASTAQAQEVATPGEEIGLPEVSSNEENTIMYTSVAIQEIKPEPIQASTVEEKKEPAYKLFNPIVEKGAEQELEAESKTEIFSPLDIIQATSRAPQQNSTPETQIAVELPKSEGVVSPAEIDVKSIPAEGKPTQIYDPSETIQAQQDSRKPIFSQDSDQQKTTLFVPVEGAGKNNENIHPSDQATSLLSSSEENVPVKKPESAGIAAIPENIKANELPALEENIDLGDDLLEDPTKFLVASLARENTDHLLQELIEDKKEKPELKLDSAFLWGKAERFLAQKNYYLARKAYRHAQALGADPALVKEKLREIRRLEMPESLYAKMSNDDGKKESISELFERLENEFDLFEEESADLVKVRSSIEKNFENILKSNDVRTILDFGVALHEMGLFLEAELLFARIVEEFPDYSFDAYYLAAITKHKRKDYAGAVSILKKLSADLDRSENEKLAIYYALGEAFEKMRQSERSKSYFKKVAEIDSNYRNIKDKLGD